LPCTFGGAFGEEPGCCMYYLLLLLRGSPEPILGSPRGCFVPTEQNAFENTA
jgi:hypothetical protein